MAPRRSKRNRKTNQKTKDEEASKDEEPPNEPQDESTIAFKLKVLGIEDLTDLVSSCHTLQDEFRVIKKAYFRKILVAHPDKGGDPEVFRSVNAAFESLRDLFENKKVTSFFKQASESATCNDSRYKNADRDVPSWSFYSNAAQDDMPLYRVELAISGRSKCRYDYCSRGEGEPPHPIPKNTVRAGSLDTQSGKYGRWHHLGCWRVPQKIWQGLPDPETCQDAEIFGEALSGMNHVVLCGFNELPEREQSLVIQHVMDKNHWANFSKPHKTPELQGDPTKRALPESASIPTEANKKPRKALPAEKENKVQGRKTKQKKAKTKVAADSTAVATAKSQALVAKQPDQLAVANSAVNGKTIVLTGVFPSIGGGCGLNLGKDRLKAMLQGMGAKVRSAVSGKTDLVIVGEDPGMGKVSKARARPNCRLVGIRDLQLAIESGATELAKLPEPKIEKFSTGYYGNALKIKDKAEPTNDKKPPPKEVLQIE